MTIHPAPSGKYRFCNHHHELTDEHEMLKALNDLGLITRTHHVDEQGGFVSIVLDNHVRFEIKTVFEADADRTNFNGKTEVLISWNNAKRLPQ